MAVAQLAGRVVDHRGVEQRAVGGEPHDHVGARGGGRARVARQHVVLASAEDAGAGGGRELGDRVVTRVVGGGDPDGVQRIGGGDTLEHRGQQRAAGNHGEALAGQAGRAHTGLDDRDDTGHRRARLPARRIRSGATPRRIAIRCDGGATLGAGHVARCRPLAMAFAAAGHDVTIVGRLDGLAAWLVDGSGLPVQAPADGPLGVDPARFDAAVVDLYDTDVCPLARALPVATVAEASRCEDAGVLLDYHLDRDAAEDGPRLLAGPRYAPVDPAFAGARRERGDVGCALVTLGGSTGVRELVLALSAAVAQAFPRARLLVTAGLPVADGVAVERPAEPSTLLDAAARADVAVTAAGMTSSELACAGVPFLALVMADNQMRVGRGLEETGVGLVLDARAGVAPEPLRERLDALADPAVPARLAAAGPRAIHGAGARRATSALAERWGFDR